MAFEELKQRQGVVWGSGPFEVVAERIADVHRDVVEAVDGVPIVSDGELGAAAEAIVHAPRRTTSARRRVDRFVHER